MASPTCLVNGLSTAGGVDVSGDTTITISLQSTSGVRSWSLECFSVDPQPDERAVTYSASSVTSALVIDQVTKSATLLMPTDDGLGTALLFRSTINGGRDINGSVQSSYTTTFGVFILTLDGKPVIAPNQTLERDHDNGWTAELCAAIRGSAGAAVGAGQNVNVDVNTLVGGRLDSAAWRVSSQTMAPAVRPLRADSADANTRSKVYVNSDGLAPYGSYLERPFTVPTGVSSIRLELDEVELPSGVGSSPNFELQLWDAAGVTEISNTSVSVTGTATDAVSAEISVTAGLEYRARVAVYLSGQARFVCGAFRVRPVTSSDSFWDRFQRIDVDDAVIRDSNETGYANPRFATQSEFAHVDVNTNATDLRLELYNNIGDYISSSYDDISVFVDGKPTTVLVGSTIGATSFASVDLSAHGGIRTRRLTIYNGPQALTGLPSPSTENRGVFLCGIYVPHASTFQVRSPQDPASCETMVIYGDSKTAGFYSDSPGRDSLTQLLRQRGHRVICETAGGRALSGDVGTTLTVAACTPFAKKLVRHKPTQVIVAIGRNDWTGGSFSPGNLVTQIGNLIDAIHNELPSAKVKILTWTPEVTETDVSGVSWATERANIAALASTRSTYCSVLDGGRLWTVAEAGSYTSDTVHPNSLGQERVYRLIAGDSFPWSPIQLSPSIWFEADSSLTAGAAMSSVTSSGTGPPAVTLTGAPTGVFRIRIEITTAGTRGNAYFRYSLNGGKSWHQQNVQTAASVVLGATSITANFAAGTYSTDNVYTASSRLGGANDLSGSSHPLVQATGGSQPTFELAGINSLPSMFHGSTQFLHRASLSQSTPYTVAVVAQVGTQAFGKCMIGGGTNVAVAPTLYCSDGTHVQCIAGGQANTVVCDASVAHVYVAVVVGGGTAGSKLYVDGTGTAWGVAPATETITDLSFGYDAVNLLSWDKWISAGMVIGRALSDDEVQSLTAYWRSKYGTA